MSKKYTLDDNEAAFLRVLYSSFAAIDLTITAAKDNKSMSQKEKLKTIATVVSKVATGLSSEYIRGELIRKGVLENDPTIICSYDPSDENAKHECEVYSGQEAKDLIK